MECIRELLPEATSPIIHTNDPFSIFMLMSFSTTRSENSFRDYVVGEVSSSLFSEISSLFYLHFHWNEELDKISTAKLFWLLSF